jgi:hypothetical protein
MTRHAQPRPALRHLQPLHAWIRLVRSDTAPATTARRRFLQHGLPGAVDHTCRQERTCRG